MFDVSEIGLKSAGRTAPSTFGIGITLAVFKQSGTFPVINDLSVTCSNAVHNFGCDITLSKK